MSLLARVRDVSRWDALAALTVAICLAVRSFLLARSWFWQDDFVVASRAQDAPLSLDWLLQGYSGHLMPAYFLQSWSLVRIAPMSWTVASVIVLLWTAAFGAATWFLVTGIVRKGPGALIALTVACLTPLWSVSASWFASAMQSITTLTLTTLAAGCAVRLARTGRARWGLATVVSFAGALLWFEKALLGIGLIVFAILAAWACGRVATLRTRALATTTGALVLLSAAYVAIFMWLVGVPEPSPAGMAETARLAYEMVFSVVPTGLAGGPWQRNTDGSTLQVLVTQPWLMWVWAAGLAVFALGWRRDRRSAAMGALMLVLACVPLVWLLARARIDFLGPAIGRDTRYSVDLVPFVALALALLISGGRRQADERLGRRARRALVAIAPAFVVIYALVSWPSVYAVADSRATRQADAWISRALGELGDHPDRVMVNGRVPSRLVSDVFGDDARVRPVLGSFGIPSSRFGQPASSWWRLDDNGELQPAVFVPVDVLVDDDASNCAIPVATSPVRVALPPRGATDGAGVQTVRMSWYSEAALTPVIQSGEERWEVPLIGGLGYLLLPRDLLSDEVVIGGLAPGEALCITRVEVGEAG